MQEKGLHLHMMNLNILQQLVVIISFIFIVLLMGLSQLHATTTNEDVIDKLEIRDLCERVKGEFESHKDLLGISEGKNIVVFMGNTGSGKSTLINYLIGHDLISEDGESYSLRYPDKKDTFPIGDQNYSLTRYPQVGIKDELLLCDLPGFRDTEGTVQNLVNAAFIHDIFTRAHSLRIVYVSNRNTFYADGRAQMVDQGVDAVRKLFFNAPRALEENGIFVLTASQQASPRDAANVLLNKKIKAGDPLYIILTQWRENDCFHHMQCPGVAGVNKDISLQEVAGQTGILAAIRNLPVLTNPDTNVEALFPHKDLEKVKIMFTHCMNAAWDKYRIHAKKLSEISELIRKTKDPYLFWGIFFKDLTEEKHIELIKRFAPSAYKEAEDFFKNQAEIRRSQFVAVLAEEKTEREQELVTAVTQWGSAWIVAHNLQDKFISLRAGNQLNDEFGIFLISEVGRDEIEKEWMLSNFDNWYHEQTSTFIQRCIDARLNEVEHRNNQAIIRLEERSNTSLNTAITNLQNRMTSCTNQLSHLRASVEVLYGRTRWLSAHRESNGVTIGHAIRDWAGCANFTSLGGITDDQQGRQCSCHCRFKESIE